MLRFTPTHVGNTPAPPVPRLLPAVHPHACGEHAQASSAAAQGGGSPPRMWGTRRDRNRRLARRRFTPTHVGNTEALRRRRDQPRFTPTHVGNTSGQATISPSAAVHPHACGEHQSPNADIVLDSGSPPRMWGTPWHRNTPTPPATVHPHACGEHTSAAISRQPSDGSPPRMWGTRND